MWVCFLSMAHINGLVHDCSNTIATTMELLQFCTKPSICDNFSHLADTLPEMKKNAGLIKKSIMILALDLHWIYIYTEFD